MKKKNKILAAVLVIAIIISALVVGTFADTKTSSVSVEVSKATLFAGESAVVTVKATANYPVATFSIPVFYDKSLVEVSEMTATLSGYAQANTTMDLTAVDTERVYNSTNVDSAKYGFVLVNYIGGANETVPATLENATVLTFKITAKADASGEAAIKCVTESAKTDNNVSGMLYFGTTTSGTTITSIPENVENISVSNASTSVMVTSGGAELVGKAGTNTVVDKENKYIYGITPNTEITDYFQVNNGSYELVASPAGATNGTGAQIKVRDISGNVVDTYTVIIFGDVNGDGTIKAADKAYITTCLAAGSTVSLTDVNVFAADVDGDGQIKAADKAYFTTCLAAGNTDNLPTNPYA